jgi:hypothetical protein
MGINPNSHIIPCIHATHKTMAAFGQKMGLMVKNVRARVFEKGAIPKCPVYSMIPVTIVKASAWLLRLGSGQAVAKFQVF